MKNKNRLFRSFSLTAQEGAVYVAEGYAAVFNQVAFLFERKGVKYYEVILPGAFDKADMSNVFMYYNHDGKPVALIGNGTLKLTVDEHGLKFWAYLGGTDEGRKLWEEIKGGYITQMSFCFIPAEGCNKFDSENVRRITEITAVFDVSATETPAYDETEVFARSRKDLSEKLKNNKNKTKIERKEEKMSLEQINARLKEIEDRKKSIAEMLENEGTPLTDIEGNPVTEEDIETEIDSLNDEEQELLAKKEELESGADDEGAARRNMLTRLGVQRNAVGTGEKKNASKSFMKEKRTKITNAEMRSLLVSSGKIASPTKTTDDITDAPRAVSSLIDQVNTEDLTGTGGIDVPFAKTVLEGEERAEGDAANEKDPDLGIACIKNTDITVMASISKKYEKVSPHKYEEKVKELAYKGLRRIAAKLIVRGSTDGNMMGVYNAKDKEGNAICHEIVISGEIDQNTLSTIVFGHGSDEEAGGFARLYLNKQDLDAFGKVRGKNELKAVYEITPDGSNPNTGIIKNGGLSVPYTICSHANAHCKATASAEGVPTMFYGDPECYTMGLFGDFEITVSKDFQFNKGLNTIMGDATLGGNVTAYKGFSVIKKKTV